MNFVIQSVSEYSSGPTKAVTAWLTDQVAPPYWRPNVEITVSTRRDTVLAGHWGSEEPHGALPNSLQACHGCQKLFEEAERKHHCRSCGEGFCHPCSSHRMPVPERGWGSTAVRVCKDCYRQGGPPDSSSTSESQPRQELRGPSRSMFLFVHSSI